MNILAFDTCLGAVSAAVRWQSARGECLLRETYEPRSTGHGEALFPMIADLMDGAGLAFTSIDRIAVTVGPGTFTGVRAGVAAARAFALATGRPVVGMTSLAAMALRAHGLLGSECQGRPLAVAVDTRRDMVYFKLFGSDQPPGAPQLLTAEQAASAIGSQPAVIVGSGATAVAAMACATTEVRLPDLQPHARLLALAAPDLKPIAPVTPLYLRQPDAKLPTALLGIQP